MLKSLGVAGDSDSGVTLAENLDELVAEIVDDLYLGTSGQERDEPPMSCRRAALAREVVDNPVHRAAPARSAGRLRGGRPGGLRQRGRSRAGTPQTPARILGYDDLLTRLATALESPDSPAATRMRQRWSIVMVDEFQDTDPVQWQVIERAFSGHSTLVLIGDPKQAIYAFRGGDIVTYLHAARTAGDRRTLGRNWRSDAALVERLQKVLWARSSATPDIKVHDVEAHHRGHRLAGAPHNAPFRLRVVASQRRPQRTPRTPYRRPAPHIAKDLAADIGALLASDATFAGQPLQARDIAVIIEKHTDARACFDALVAAGIPAVYTGDTDVFESQAAEDWLCLLEAFDQPHRPGLVRAAAATMFFGETAETLADGGDALTDRVAETLRQWADHARERGVAAVFEAAQLAGMGQPGARRGRAANAT